jgi:hypothetical protein
MAQIDRTARLGMESLEVRLQPAVTFHGGAVLTHVEEQNIYVGSAWNTIQGRQVAQKLEQFAQTLVNSPFMDALTQAGYGVGRGTDTRGTIDPVSIRVGTVTDSQIQQEIQRLISQGLAQPDANRLYVVYMQPGVAVFNNHDGSSSTKDFLGYHGAFAGKDAHGRAVDIHYAVLPYPGGPNFTAASQGFANNLDQLTAVTSHEVAEAVTDPNVNYKQLGWYDDAHGEIGDITAGHTQRMGQFLIQNVSDQNDQPLLLSGATTVSTGNSAGHSSTVSMMLAVHTLDSHLCGIHVG